MQNLLVVYKPRGLTPLQMITNLKRSSPLYQNQVISYAGRLDPMAEGIMLLLVGDENKKRKSYEALEKEYEFDVLFGITTDTYDVLGRIQTIPTPPQPDRVEEKLKKLLPTLRGEQQQPYPPYSSFHVKNKPLFYWAREGRLSEITIPTKAITIHTLDCLAFKTVSVIELGKSVMSDIRKVAGEFRQTDILSDWNTIIDQKGDLSLPLATLKVTCTSGTYVRSLAHRLGEGVGCGAIVTRIQRTRVGNYTFAQATSLAGGYNDLV